MVSSPAEANAELSDFIEASGLLSYDPAAITRIYAGHPQRLIRRLWQTLVPIGLYLLGVGFDWLTGQLKTTDRARSRAKEAADLVASLGPAFIKAGQALSTRPDIVPPLLLEELAQLQDQLPGFDSALAMACIEDDLGAPVLTIYEQLDAEPISAASLGQVHKGVLKGGQAVAVKVQRPGLREQITLDLYIVRNIAAWLNQNVGLIRSDLVALIDELGKRVFEEMDYCNEAANAERFAALHASNPRIAVPRIYHQATSRRVLTMEWIEGVKLTNLEAVRGIGVDPDDMVTVGGELLVATTAGTRFLPRRSPPRQPAGPLGRPPRLSRFRHDERGQPGIAHRPDPGGGAPGKPQLRQAQQGFRQPGLPGRRREPRADRAGL